MDSPEKPEENASSIPTQNDSERQDPSQAEQAGLQTLDLAKLLILLQELPEDAKAKILEALQPKR